MGRTGRSQDLKKKFSEGSGQQQQQGPVTNVLKETRWPQSKLQRPVQWPPRSEWQPSVDRSWRCCSPRFCWTHWPATDKKVNCADYSLSLPLSLFFLLSVLPLVQRPFFAITWSLFFQSSFLVLSLVCIRACETNMHTHAHTHMHTSLSLSPFLTQMHTHTHIHTHI